MERIEQALDKIIDVVVLESADMSALSTWLANVQDAPKKTNVLHFKLRDNVLRALLAAFEESALH